MRILTAVFLADITPSTPITGWCAPPILRASAIVATSEWGVAQTRKHTVTDASRYLMNFWKRSAPSIRSIPNHK